MSIPSLTAASTTGAWITGNKMIEKKLKKLSISVQRNIARKAMRNGLALMRKEARSLAPKRTGRLRKAIKTKVSLRPNGDMIGRVYIKTKGPGGAPYAHLVEWGGGTISNPHRFMTRAFEFTKDDFFEEFRRIMLIEIAKQANVKTPGSYPYTPLSSSRSVRKI